MGIGSIAPGSAGTDATPAWSYGIGTGCYDGPRENVGWMHVVASGEYWSTTLNATVVHPPEKDVRVNLSQRPTGGYEIALRTVDRQDTKRGINETCLLASTLDVATGLPEPNVVVTMNDREIRAVSQDETTANLYPLPNPINATG
jgi:hypothetical protein